MNLLANEEEFQRWADHPGTKAFHQFLKDRVSMLSRAWAAGSLKEECSQREAQCQAETLLDLSSLNFDDVASFYEAQK